MTLCLEISQERSCHALTIYNHSCMRLPLVALFIAKKDLGKANRQVLVPTSSDGESRMPLLIVQEYQGTTPQNLARTTDQSSWNQLVGVDGLAVAIDVETRTPFLLGFDS